MKKSDQTIGRRERREKQIDQNAEHVIRMVAAERLGIGPQVSVGELAKKCIPSAEFKVIEIDGSDPQTYRPMAT